MKIRHASLFAFCAVAFFSITVHAQTPRVFHSQQIVLDNDSTPLYFYTIKTPDGMANSDTLSLPIPPPNNPPSGFVFTGNNPNDILRWKIDPVLYPMGAWVPTSLDSLGGAKGLGATGQVSYWATADSITGNNNFFWDTTNGRLGIGTMTPEATIGSAMIGLTISADDAAATGDAHQITVQSATNNNQELELGFNSGTAHGAIQAYDQSTGAITLDLNPAGGTVTIGAVNPANLDMKGNQINNVPSLNNNGASVRVGVAPYPDIQLSAGHLDMNGTELWDTFSGSVQMGSQLNMSGHAIVDGTGTISMGNNVDMGGHQISNLGELDNGANPVTMGSTLDLNGHFITDNNTGVVHIADPAGANDNISIGENNTVTGNNGATAIGNGNTASGSSTLAEGNAVTASGPNSVAMGQANDAAGYASAVIGQNDTATGNEAMAFGQNLTATGANSIVLGHSATANNAGSFVFGDGSARAFDNAADEFIALATGGVTFYTNAAQTNFVQIQSAGNLTNNTANPIFAGGSDGIGAQGLNWAINAQGYALSLTNNQNVAGHPGEGLGILVADQTSSNWALNVTNTSGQLFGVRGDGVVTVTNGNLTMNGNQINNVSELNNGGSGLTIGNGTEAATIPNAVVQSGSIDNTPIGATTPSTGVFTAVSAKANSTAANPYAVAASDFLVTETTGGAAVDLPAATAGAGRMVVVNNGSAGAVTVTPSGTDTIAGAANFNLAASGNSVTLISDGVSNWVVMGSH